MMAVHVGGRERMGWNGAWWKGRFESVFLPENSTTESGEWNCCLLLIPETSIPCLTSRRRKGSSATGGRWDWFSARHQDSVEPLAWQPTDLRSPSIVCLIDYFPCNYSRVTLNISLLHKGGKRDFLFEGRHSYCHICEPLMWIVKRHMLNWSPERAISGVWC